MDWRDVDAVTRLKWREPYAMTRRRAFEELRALRILEANFWGSVFVLSCGAVGLFLLWAFLATPGLVVPWNQMIVAFVSLVLVFVGVVVIGTYCPVWVDVRLDRIDIVQGQANCRIHPRDLAEAVIVEE
ncbi:MAG: hypothetical protein EA380_00780 [Phycisphaeraceae bacterium]|nr:MAG: hypothetical protein EA380_00780 [Phycisphaeraceae bacterium]